MWNVGTFCYLLIFNTYITFSQITPFTIWNHSSFYINAFLPVTLINLYMYDTCMPVFPVSLKCLKHFAGVIVIEYYAFGCVAVIK